MRAEGQREISESLKYVAQEFSPTAEPRATTFRESASWPFGLTSHTRVMNVGKASVFGKTLRYPMHRLSLPHL